jgi:hypothetical protein
MLGKVFACGENANCSVKDEFNRCEGYQSLLQKRLKNYPAKRYSAFLDIAGSVPHPFCSRTK